MKCHTLLPHQPVCNMLCHVKHVMSCHQIRDMSKVSFHDIMSRHVMSSCHVVMLETDPCVCPCQYSPTHVKDQNPCLCVKCQFQHSRPHRSRQSLARKRPKTDQTKCLAPFSALKHVGGDMSNMSFHDVMSRHVMSCSHVRD